MQIPLLIVPPSPGTASALGLLVTDLKHEFSQTRIMPKDRTDFDEINRIFAAMEDQGRAGLKRERLAEKDISFQRQIEMRYAGQSYELPIECPGGEVTSAELEDVVDRFHVEHDRAYGHGYPDQPIELVNFRLTALGAIQKPRLREISSANGSQASAVNQRPVYFGSQGDFVPTAIYDRTQLKAGHRIEGPAIVEEIDSTTLVQPGFQVEVDRYGNLLISPLA
jgi:N-methylhydantoinase A